MFLLKETDVHVPGAAQAVGSNKVDLLRQRAAPPAFSVSGRKPRAAPFPPFRRGPFLPLLHRPPSRPRRHVAVARRQRRARAAPLTAAAGGCPRRLPPSRGAGRAVEETARGGRSPWGAEEKTEALPRGAPAPQPCGLQEPGEAASSCARGRRALLWCQRCAVLPGKWLLW